MDYGKILSRAVGITWKHKSLWLFGFLVALFSGGGNINYQLQDTDFEQMSRGGTDLIRIPRSVETFPDYLSLLLLLFIPLVFFLILLAIFVPSLAQAAMIGMVEQVETKGETSIRDGFKIGWSCWLRLLGISVVVGIAVFLYLLLAGAISFSQAVIAFVVKEEIAGIVLLGIGVLIFLILFIPPVIMISIIVDFAFRSTVLKREGVFASLREGYRLFRANLGRSLLFWLMMMVVGMAIGIVFVVALMFFVLPIALSSAISIWLTIALAFPIVIAAAFFSGLVQVFTSAAWTLAWRELSGIAPGPELRPETAGYPVS